MQLDDSTRDARNIEQVVDEVYELVNLALHDGAHPVKRAAVFTGQPQDVQGVLQGRERVSQLVCERREKLVLAPGNSASRKS